jgi:hypothetical protein
MRCPDIWSNIILGFLWECLGEINIWINRPSKADCPPQCRWALSNQLTAWVEQKCWPSLKWERIPPAQCPSNIGFFLLLDVNWNAGSHLLLTGLELQNLLSSVSSLLMSHNCVSQILTNLFINIHLTLVLPGLTNLSEGRWLIQHFGQLQTWPIFLTILFHFALGPTCNQYPSGCCLF